MTNKKSTKSALMSSIVALVLCFAMLLGTTYAWFTDSAASEGNVIKSGTLDVELYWADGSKEVPVAVEGWTKASDGPIYTEDQIWEPGYTDAKHIMISNLGNLALKYQLAIIPNGEVSALADVIDVYMYDGAATQVATRDNLQGAEHVGTLADLINKGIKRGNLLADEDYTATLVLKMREDAGNEYQELSIGTDFSIRILATQLSSEFDSFDEYYDGGAAWLGDLDMSWYDPDATELSIGTPEQLAALAAIVNGTATVSTYAANGETTVVKDSFKGQTIKLASDVDLNNIPWTPIGTTSHNGFYGTFDGQGHTIKNLVLTPGSGNYGAGFFGNLLSGSAIKNVTFDAPSCDIRANIVGVAAGYLYGSATFENVKVVNADVRGFGKVGGILGMSADPGAHTVTMTNCSVEGTIGGTYNVGGLIGLVLQGNTVNLTDCTTNVQFVLKDASYNKTYSQDADGNWVWNYSENSLYAAVAEQYCYYDNAENELFAGVAKNVDVLMVNEALLGEAFAKGGEIILDGDVVVENTLTVPADVTVTLDLNGYTMSMVETDTITKNQALINNKGTLTIVDSSAEQTGKLSYKYDGGQSTWVAATTISNNHGTLTIKGGTIESLSLSTNSQGVSTNVYKFAVDNLTNGSAGEAILNVEGGKITAAKGGSVRGFANSTTDTCEINISGGEMVGQVWLQNPSNNANKGTINITGGDFMYNNNTVDVLDIDAGMASSVTGGTYADFSVLKYASNGADVTVKLAEDFAGDVTVAQKQGVNVVIDGNEKVFSGTLNIAARSESNITETLLIKNINFKTTENKHNFIYSVQTNYYPSNVTISGCTFEGTGADSDVVPITLKSSNNVVIENCKATKVHSLLQNTSGWNLTIRDCEVTESGRGISLGTVQGCLIQNVKIEASDVKYGIRMDAAYAVKTTIKNCEISAYIPVVVRSVSAAYTVEFNGVNIMTEANTEGLWCVAANNEYGDVDKAGLTNVGANVTITLNDTGLDANGVFVKKAN